MKKSYFGITTGVAGMTLLSSTVTNTGVCTGNCGACTFSCVLPLLGVACLTVGSSYAIKIKKISKRKDKYQ